MQYIHVYMYIRMVMLCISGLESTLRHQFEHHWNDVMTSNYETRTPIVLLAMCVFASILFSLPPLSSLYLMLIPSLPPLPLSVAPSLTPSLPCSPSLTLPPLLPSSLPHSLPPPIVSPSFLLSLLSI